MADAAREVGGDTAGHLSIDAAIEVDEHDDSCRGRRNLASAFRYWLCPECGRTVDTFGGNVD